MNDIISSLPNYTFHELWNDFIHCKINHFLIDITDVWNYFESKSGKCNFMQCELYQRNHRNRDISGNAKIRQMLYYGFIKSEEIVIIQLLDIIHEFIFHSKFILQTENKLQTLLLSSNNPSNDNINNNNNQNDINLIIKKKSIDINAPQTPKRKSTQPKSTILKRASLRKQKKEQQQQQPLNQQSQHSKNETHEFENKAMDQSFNFKEFQSKIIQHYQNKENKNNHKDNKNKNKNYKISKFITEVCDHNIKNQSNNNKISFGVSFVYWAGYNTWHTYIDATKYKNFKDEMFNNPFFSTTTYQWNDTLIKSVILKKTNKGKKWCAGILNKRYGVSSYLPISISHIMSILFYTNFNVLQYLFKKHGCRKLSMNETTNNVRARNILIGNWYKLFIECVTLFGEITNNKQIFYHCLIKKILFNKFQPNFNLMISTTSLLTVCYKTMILSNMNNNINKDGIIIKLQQQSSVPYGFLNVSWMSEKDVQNKIKHYNLFFFFFCM